VDFNKDFSTLTNTGHAIVAVNIASFADVREFKEKVDRVWQEMKSSPKLPGFDEIRLPGERSARIYQDRMANGVPLSRELYSSLDALADRLGVPRL
jgi:LDH2 family malate/lactate/ureidoglycolate dehydrogenase